MLATACNFGAVGSRLPSCNPPTTIVLPAVSLVVTVEVSTAFTQVADSPKSQFAVGRANSSASRPVLWAVGTLKTIREEHWPAVVVACRL